MTAPDRRHPSASRKLRQSSDDDLFQQYQTTRDQSLRNELVARHLWLAERCARRYRDRGEPHDDLVQVGRFGLVKAVERYDPSCGPFVGFATPTIIGVLKHHFRDTTWAIAVPRRAKELRSRVNAATESLRHELNRAPTVDELAEYAGLPREHVIETLGADRAYRSLSLDSLTLSDRQPRSVGPLDESADSVDRETMMLSRDLIARLDELERNIVYFTYFQGLTQREIGDRLGLGQVQVSRHLAAALATLRRHLLRNASDAA